MNAEILFLLLIVATTPSGYYITAQVQSIKHQKVQPSHIPRSLSIFLYEKGFSDRFKMG